MAVIIKTDASGVPSYLTGSGSKNWSENQADARVFADGAAATAFLSANPQSQVTIQLTVTGKVHFGKKSANE